MHNIHFLTTSEAVASEVRRTIELAVTEAVDKMCNESIHQMMTNPLQDFVQQQIRQAA